MSPIDQIIKGTKFGEDFSIFILLSGTVGSYDVITVCVVASPRPNSYKPYPQSYHTLGDHNVQVKIFRPSRASIVPCIGVELVEIVLFES